MAQPSQHTGLSKTILFVDICGSTKLYDALGNTQAQAVISKALAMFAQSATRHNGVIVKNIGDEIMCTFPTPHAAAQGAIDMQRKLKEAIAADDIKVKTLAIRTGFHSGPVITDGADVFGDAVNIAARVAAYAKPGQILITRETVMGMPPGEADNVRFVGNTQVKGKRETIELFELIWEHSNLTMMQDMDAIRADPARRLMATFRDKTIEIGDRRPVLQLGRGAENDVVVNDPLASRMHARIEHRGDRFVLIDQSLNGTFVKMQGRDELALKREEIVLAGSGLIALGKSTLAESDACVTYTILS
jgi:class 3 adenylate cyclase